MENSPFLDIRTYSTSVLTNPKSKANEQRKYICTKTLNIRVNCLELINHQKVVGRTAKPIRNLEQQSNTLDVIVAVLNKSNLSEKRFGRVSCSVRK